MGRHAGQRRALHGQHHGPLPNLRRRGTVRRPRPGRRRRSRHRLGLPVGLLRRQGLTLVGTGPRGIPPWSPRAHHVRFSRWRRPQTQVRAGSGTPFRSARLQGPSFPTCLSSGNWGTVRHEARRPAFGETSQPRCGAAAALAARGSIMLPHGGCFVAETSGEGVPPRHRRKRIAWLLSPASFTIRTISPRRRCRLTRHPPEHVHRVPSRRAMTADRRIATMPHRVLYNVDLPAWLYGTIKKHRQGESWQDASERRECQSLASVGRTGAANALCAGTDSDCNDGGSR